MNFEEFQSLKNRGTKKEKFLIWNNSLNDQERLLEFSLLDSRETIFNFTEFQRLKNRGTKKESCPDME